jgi:hypothetical protein
MLLTRLQRVYHTKCAGLLRVPKGAFTCPLHGAAAPAIKNTAMSSTYPSFHNSNAAASKTVQTPASTHGMAVASVDLGLEVLSQSLKVPVEIVGDVRTTPYRALISLFCANLTDFICAANKRWHASELGCW